MPRIWCAISGHGYGHAAQVVPVLNELSRRIPGTTVLLRTTVPAKFFASRLTVPWELSAQAQDVGCVQQGPLTIDVPATWRAYHDFHNAWDQRIVEECKILKQYAPDLVLSNISYLALEAGARAGVPAIAYGSLSWDHILHEFVDSHNHEHTHIVGHIRETYKRAELAIRLTPASPMDAFSRYVDVGPVGYPLPPESHPITGKISRASDGPLVLVALGGVPMDSLPFDAIDQLSPYQFILDMPLSSKFSRLRPSGQFGMSFVDLFGASDIILTKPGYGTVIEAVAAGKPIIYVRRYNFADEGVLVEFAHRYGRAVELSKDAFYSGSWREALAAVLALPLPSESPPESGVSAAADVLAAYLKMTGK
jgi:hypothetical protein